MPPDPTAVERGQQAEGKADWRSQCTYDYARGLPRRAWAWEFLRRNPSFRSAWLRDSRASVSDIVAPNLKLVRLSATSGEAPRWGVIFR